MTDLLLAVLRTFSAAPSLAKRALAKPVRGETNCGLYSYAIGQILHSLDTRDGTDLSIFSTRDVFCASGHPVFVSRDNRGCHE